MKIISDFSEYYDPYLQSIPMPSSFEFRRNLSDRLNKPEQLKLLEQFGANVPRYGTPISLMRTFGTQNRSLNDTMGNEVVIYPPTDQLSELKLPLEVALASFPEVPAVEYVIEDNHQNMGQVLKLLQVGNVQWTYELINNHPSSDQQWKAGRLIGEGPLLMSNTRPMANQMSVIDPSFNQFYPIYELDLISRNGSWFCVSFDPCPRLTGTPIESFVEDSTITEALCESIMHVMSSFDKEYFQCVD